MQAGGALPRAARLLQCHAEAFADFGASLQANPPVLVA